MASYPIHTNGMTFNTGSEFHEWVDALYEKRSLSASEVGAIYYTYDNGYLAHPDYKTLIRKPQDHQRSN